MSCTSDLQLKPKTADDVQKGLDLAKAAYVSAGAGVVEFCANAPLGDEEIAKFCKAAPTVAADLGNKLDNLLATIRLLALIGKAPTATPDTNALWIKEVDPKPLSPATDAQQ